MKAESAFVPGLTRSRVRPPFAARVALLALLCAAVLLIGCRTPIGLSGPRGQGIPDRPESLSFSELNYEPPDPAEFRVELRSGPVAYVAEDRELPLVNVNLLVRVGHYLDSAGEEGLGDIAGFLLSRGGTETRTAEELEERLAFLAAHLESRVGNVMGSVSLNLLSKDLEEGLTILREVLATPRFQEDKLALRKQQLLQAMKRRNDASADIESREREFLAYGDEFWSNQYDTESSVESITRAKLLKYHQKWFHPSNFVVTASGDFDRDEMIEKLEALFDDWPFRGDLPPGIPTNTVFASPGAYLINKEVNQGRVSVLIPGVLRNNPDIFAVTLMNRILGGGGFTSRIMSRVRSDEGLAYAAASSFSGGVYFPPPFVAFFQTKSRTVPYATSIILEEMQRIAAEPVSVDELQTEKNSMIETFPRAFSSKARTVNRFATDEFTGRYSREPDYWKTYRPRVNAVTVEDVQRVARKYLDLDEVVILVVGEREKILKGHPDHDVTLESLAHGKVHNLPLRDPMTMEPLSE